jgi:hypothetical protein
MITILIVGGIIVAVYVIILIAVNLDGCIDAIAKYQEGRK